MDDGEVGEIMRMVSDSALFIVQNIEILNFVCKFMLSTEIYAFFRNLQLLSDISNIIRNSQLHQLHHTIMRGRAKLSLMLTILSNTQLDLQGS